MSRKKALLASAVLLVVSNMSGAFAMNDALTAIKARDHLAIQRRIVVLTGLKARVNAAKHLQAVDQTELLGQFRDAENGLSSLDQQIQADATLAAVRADQQKIVTDYRIYVLVVPKTHVVIAADRLSYIGTTFSKLVARLQSAIDRAKANGRNTGAAQAALDDMEAKIQSALNETSGVPGLALPLQASGYPGNRATLLDARGKLAAARADLRVARADAAKVIAALIG